LANLAPWLVALALGGAAIAAFWLWTAAGARAERLAEHAHRIAAERDAAQRELEKRAEAARRKEAELVELRAKLDKARRRAHDEKNAQRGAEPRVAELEEELRLRGDDLRAARAEIDALAAELARRERDAAAARAPVEAEAAARAAEAAARAGETEAERGRAARAEAETIALRAEVAALQEKNDRLRKSVHVQRELYASIQSDLALKKDRLRAQQEELERLRARWAGLVHEVEAEDRAEPDGPAAGVPPPGSLPPR
jgi:chromosome segregation ATPase